MNTAGLHHAMILAAGLGTRLRPLTDYCPKALVRIAGVPLLERLIDRLKAAGIRSLTVNVHHLAGQVEDFLREKGNFGMEITISDERGALLDSGGGIRKAASFFPPGAPVLVHNVDVLTSLDIGQMAAFYQEHRPLALLAVRQRTTQRYYLFDRESRLCGWKNTATGEEILAGNPGTAFTTLAFSGISILSPDFIGQLQGEGAFPIRDEFLRQCRAGYILAYRHDADSWTDVGRPEQLRVAERQFTG